MNIRSSRIFARCGNRTFTIGLSLGEALLRREQKMRILPVIFGAAAAVAVAAPVSADPTAGRVQFAQTQDSQSGSGASQQGSSGMQGGQQGSSGQQGGSAQQGSSGQQGSGAAATRQGGGQATVGGGTQSTSRTT